MGKAKIKNGNSKDAKIEKKTASAAETAAAAAAAAVKL